MYRLHCLRNAIMVYHTCCSFFEVHDSRDLIRYTFLLLFRLFSISNPLTTVNYNLLGGGKTKGIEEQRKTDFTFETTHNEIPRQSAIRKGQSNTKQTRNTTFKILIPGFAMQQCLIYVKILLTEKTNQIYKIKKSGPVLSISKIVKGSLHVQRF